MPTFRNPACPQSAPRASLWSFSDSRRRHIQFRQVRAHRALFGFLQRAHHEGLTFVLVVTGKGKIGSEAERGVLRRQVPQWLSLPEFRSMVVGFEEAHIGHGGEGALYVRVRRSRG